MPTNNEVLYENALDAISALFADESVSVVACKGNLQALITEIEIMLDSLTEPDEEGDGRR